LREFRISRPDGSARWIRDRAFPVRSADGTVYRAAGVAEDISERLSFVVGGECAIRGEPKLVSPKAVIECW